MTNKKLATAKFARNNGNDSKARNKSISKVSVFFMFVPIFLVVCVIVVIVVPWAKLFTNKEFYEYNDNFIPDVTEKGIEVDFLSGSEEYEGEGKDTVKTETRNYLLHLDENTELQVVFKSHLKNYINCLSYEVWCYTYAYFVNGDDVQDIYEWANTNGLEIEPRLYY